LAKVIAEGKIVDRLTHFMALIHSLKTSNPTPPWESSS